MSDSAFTNELMAAGLAWLPASLLGEAGGDITSVLDFGADPTGIKDSAPAINQALATGNPTWMPKGNYLVRSALNVGSGGRLYGDGRGITNILVDQTFSPTDLGVIVLTGVEDQAPIVSDLRVAFQQPADQASRSNFLTLAQGGTSVPGGTGIKYPPAFYSSASGRWKLARLRVDSAWDGIYSSTGQPGFITEIEMGAFNRGLVVGESRDFVHISAFHFWNFGFNSSQPIFNVFTDGNTFAARFGEFGGAEGVEITDFTTFVGRIYIENSLSWLTFNGLMCDQGATVEINGCDWVLINNMYYTGPPQGSNTNSPITQYGAFGQVQITNLYGLNTHTPFITHSAGILHISGSLFGSNGFPNIPAILSSAGQLFLDSSLVYVNDAGFGAWTGPIIDVTGGTFSMRGCSFQPSVSGAQPGLVITTDSADNYVGNNNFNGWPFTAPGTLGFYSYNSDGNVQGPVHISGGNLFVPTVTASAAVVVTGAAGTQRNVVYETAGSERWVVAANNAPETGGNAGSDFIIGAVADDGTSPPAVQFPLQITRATGAVLLRGLVNKMLLGAPAAATGTGTTVIGPTGAGASLTTGNNNVIIGGNSGSTIATLSGNMILSDGAGNILAEYLSANGGWSITGATHSQGLGSSLLLTSGGANAGLSAGVIKPILNVGNGGNALQGSVTSATPTLGIFASVTNDQVAASGAAGGTDGHLFGLSFGGSALGGRTAVAIALTQTGTTANTTTSTFYTGLGITATATSNDNGTSGARINALFGFNPIVKLNAAATYFTEICGGEIDIVAACSGGPPAWKTGLKVISFTGDAANGTVIDTAFGIGASSSSTVGWIVAYTAAGTPSTTIAGSRWPLDSAGTILGAWACATGSNTVAYGFDCNTITITSFFLRGPSATFTVDGSGNTTVASVAFASTATITSGTGAPSATTPAGSVYLREGGSLGSRLYVSAGGGSWNAVVGV